MSANNVVPFEALLRKTMARRGAPDKAFTPKALTLDCPFCAEMLCLDAESASKDLETLCSNCDRVIDLAGAETADSRR